MEKVNKIIDDHTRKKTEVKHIVRQHTIRMKQLDPDFSYESSDSESNVSLPTESSKIVATDELQKKLDRGKRSKVISQQGSHSKKWKISIVRHRKQRRAWEIFIIFVALYSVMVIPIRIAIKTDLGGLPYDVVDLITWIIYFFDIFVNCRTTYLDNFGIEVHETKKILMHYLFSLRFAMDFLSLLNFPVLFWKDPGLIFNILGMLKTLRFLRAQDLIR